MAYCSRTDLEGRLPRVGGEVAFAPLTTSQVDAIIEGIDAEIDVVLAGLGHAVPVTAPETAVRYLKHLSVSGAAAAVQRARFREGSGANQESQWSFFQKRYQEGLDRLPAMIDGLLGAPTAMQPTSFWQDNPTDPNVEPVLTTAMEW